MSRRFVPRPQIPPNHRFDLASRKFDTPLTSCMFMKELEHVVALS
jgi:hypothetical protein